MDSAGNAYVTGTTKSTQSSFPDLVGPDLTYNGDPYDGFIAKISPEGSLLYCGYIGGAGREVPYQVAVDAAGRAYVTGYTDSTAGFPVQVGPDLTFNGESDAFIARVSGDGTALEYCGYLGGSTREFGTDVAVDSSGRAYLVGTTRSSEATFPVSVGPDLTYNGGVDAFVARVSSTGSALEYCGYLGGDQMDNGWGIDVDGSDQAVLSGGTKSTEATFPVLRGPDTTHNGDWDAYVAQVTTDGSALVYCGYLGGSGADGGAWNADIGGADVALDADGNAYLTGSTNSTAATFPVTASFDAIFNGGASDAFVAKIADWGDAISYCGYVGSSGDERGVRIAVDGRDQAHIVGVCGPADVPLPTTDGLDGSYNGGASDAFFASVDVFGTDLFACGYLGGSHQDEGAGIAADAAGGIYLTGMTGSTWPSFPVRTGPDLTHNGGVWEAWVAHFGPAPALEVSSVNLNDNDFTGERFTFGSVTLSRVVSAHTSVNLTSSHPALLSVPEQVVVPAGLDHSGAFRVNSNRVAATTTVTITARVGGSSATADVTLQPNGPVFVGLAKGGSECTGGSTPRGVVDLELPAPTGGAAVDIESDTPAVAAPDRSVVAIGRRFRRGGFIINTQPVAAPTVVRFTARMNGIEREFSLTVLPPVMQAWVVVPPDVTGGQTSRGQVVLDKVPAVDTVVQLSTTVPSATVPATVTIPAGVRKVKFAIRTTAVTSRETGIVSATLNGVSRTAPLSVNP